MWGSAFADLAKKVEEQASALSAFNLDAMQQDGGKQRQEEEEEERIQKEAAVRRRQEEERNAKRNSGPPIPAPTAASTAPRLDSSGSTSSNFVSSTPTTSAAGLYGFPSMLHQSQPTPRQKQQQPPKTRRHEPTKPKQQRQAEPDFFSDWDNGESAKKANETSGWEKRVSPALQTVAAAVSGSTIPKKVPAAGGGNREEAKLATDETNDTEPPPSRDNLVARQNHEKLPMKPAAAAEEEETAAAEMKTIRDTPPEEAAAARVEEVPPEKPQLVVGTPEHEGPDAPTQMEETVPTGPPQPNETPKRKGQEAPTETEHVKRALSAEKQPAAAPFLETPRGERDTIDDDNNNDDDKFQTPLWKAHDDQDEQFFSPALETPPTAGRSVNDEDVGLLSPDIQQVVTEITQTSDQLDRVLHSGVRQLVSPTSDAGSIGMELNNLANSEEALRLELEESEGVENEEQVVSEEGVATDVVVGPVGREENAETAPADEQGSAVHDDDDDEEAASAPTMEQEATRYTAENEAPLEQEPEASGMDRGTPDASTEIEHPTKDDGNEMPEENGPKEQSLIENGDLAPFEQEPESSGMDRGTPTVSTLVEQPDVREVDGPEEGDGEVVGDNVVPFEQEQPGMDRGTPNDSTHVVEQQQPNVNGPGEQSPGDKDTTADKKKEATVEKETAVPTAVDTLSDNVMGMFSSKFPSQFQMLSPFVTEANASAKVDSPPAAHSEQAEADTESRGTENSEPAVAAVDKDTAVQKDLATAASDPPVPDHVIEMFSGQIQRLEEYHASELKEIEQRHAAELEAALKHDECFKKMRSLEKEWNAKLKESDEQVSTLLQKNEGMSLKMEALQRELDGTKAMLDQRESDFGQATATHSRDVHSAEQKLKDAESAASAKAAEVERLNEALKSSQAELESSNDAYTKLKGRVKVVATELKERRIECRGLNTNVEELKATNESLQTQIDNLQNQLKEQNRVRMESNEGMEVLRSRVEELESELSTAEKKLKERDVVGEKALACYKKKAQAALAAANARAASANHAREEAELEASAVRNAGEAALERGRVAERKAKETMLQAEKKTQALEEQNKVLMNTLSEANDSYKRAEEELQTLRSEMEGSHSSKEKLISELATIGHELEEERARTCELTHELDEARATCNTLRNETEILREEVQRSSAAAAIAGQRDSTADMGAGGVSPSVLNGEDDNIHSASNGAKLPIDESESDATIFMLQEELQEANEAIKELKEALKNSLQKSQGIPPSPEDVSSPRSYDSYGPTDTHRSNVGNQGSDATPLFYALEKQAELNTARDEITRLANLLGDAESARMEAQDAMEEMRIRMQEAEARLRRHEKLGPASSRPDGSAGWQRHAAASAQNGTAGEEWNGNDSTVNLEYLKNVMLSFLNAKSLAERRALVPVLAAVLELTPDEQAKAMRNVEESGELNGVGNAFLESLGSKVQQLM